MILGECYSVNISYIVHPPGSDSEVSFRKDKELVTAVEIGSIDPILGLPFLLSACINNTSPPPYIIPYYMV